MEVALQKGLLDFVEVPLRVLVSGASRYRFERAASSALRLPGKNTVLYVFLPCTQVAHRTRMLPARRQSEAINQMHPHYSILVTRRALVRHSPS